MKKAGDVFKTREKIISKKLSEINKTWVRQCFEGKTDFVEILEFIVKDDDLKDEEKFFLFSLLCFHAWMVSNEEKSNKKVAN